MAEDEGVEVTPDPQPQTVDVATDWQVGWGWAAPSRPGVVGPDGQPIPARQQAMVGFTFQRRDGSLESFALPVEQANALARATLKHVRAARTAGN